MPREAKPQVWWHWMDGNTIEVEVTNLWRNRMIGDVQKEEEHPVTAIRRFYTSKDALLPSGLLGPVTLIGYSRE